MKPRIILVDDQPDVRLLAIFCAAHESVEADALVFGDGIGIDAAELPTEIDLLTEATYKGYSLPGTGEITDFTVTASHIEACVTHFKERKALNPERDLVIDYEHQTWKGGEAPAAGWIEDIFAIARDGKKVLRAKVRMWTDRAKEYLKNKEYRFMSPVFALNAVDKKSGKTIACILYNAGLTNEPLFDELQPIVSSLNFKSKHISGKDTAMDELLERLRYFLGVPITATAQEIMAELNKLIGQIKESIGTSEASVTAKALLAELTNAKNALMAKNEVFTVLGLKPEASVEEAKAKIVTITGSSAQVLTLQTEVNTLKDRELNREFDRIIAKAFQEGRILPVQKSDAAWLKVQKDWAAKDFPGFEAYFAKAAVVGPIQKLPESSEGIKGSGLTETDLVIAKNLGVTEDLLKKHNAAA